MSYKDHRASGKVTTSRDSNNFRVVDKVEAGYIPIPDQLDQLWHDINDGKLDKTGSWYLGVKEVKDRFPKS